ncbi:leucine-rich repeat domain-containing protein [Eisenbergiella porci]|uniref:leucine-rich repeat domain-containing protein n=1 Tax=Eisenbergiella porci TaxID=2652274 RepID=UPI002A8380AF|nr:leucine-rich repeat domain-containing protein [Eisenbergiella porci]
MLLIKLTALIMGMVMALTGMNNAFPQSSLLPEQGKRPAQAACLPRPRGAAERAALLPVMLVEEPIARPAQTGFDIMQTEAYGFNVSGQWTTGPGPDSIPWGIWFSNSDAVLLVDVRPTVPEKSTFTQNWEDTKKALEQSAEAVLGNNLEAIDFYTKQGNGESTIYVVEFAGSQVDGSWYVTVCYCFGDNYMAEFIGVNPYSAADCREITMGASRSFRELGKAGQREGVKAQGMGQENWPYPYLHNPFAIVAYYMDAEAPHFPSLERSASDYEIKWKDKGIETIVRALLEKDSGPVMSSDLDRYESFYVVGWLGDFYRIGMGDRMMEIPSDGLTIRTLEDLQEFGNLVSLTFEVRDFTDVSPLSGLKKLKYLNLMVSPKLSNLDFLNGMPQLEELMMWGESYPEIKDISVFQGMDSLRSVMIILPSIKDISVFAGLPNLETLWINCHKNVDAAPVIAAGQIESLMINAEEIR